MLLPTNNNNRVGTVRSYEKQTRVPSRLTDVITVSAGFDHSLARKCKSTVVGVGRTTYGQSRVPSGISSAVAIGVGGVVSSTGTWCADCTSTS